MSEQTTSTDIGTFTLLVGVGQANEKLTPAGEPWVAVFGRHAADGTIVRVAEFPVSNDAIGELARHVGKPFRIVATLVTP